MNTQDLSIKRKEFLDSLPEDFFDEIIKDKELSQYSPERLKERLDRIIKMKRYWKDYYPYKERRCGEYKKNRYHHRHGKGFIREDPLKDRDMELVIKVVIEDDSYDEDLIVYDRDQIIKDIKEEIKRDLSD